MLIKATGSEEVKKVKKKEAEQYKAHLSSEQKANQQLIRPNEQIKTQDGALIINYEVPTEEDVVYAGGVRGIRALRQQRDQLSS